MLGDRADTKLLCQGYAFTWTLNPFNLRLMLHTSRLIVLHGPSSRRSCIMSMTARSQLWYCDNKAQMGRKQLPTQVSCMQFTAMSQPAVSGKAGRNV